MRALLLPLVCAVSGWSCVPGPAGERQQDPLARVCSALLALEGRVERTVPQPGDVFGCWPVGQWRFSALVEENGCPAPPVLESEYRFEVTRDAEENEVYRYLNDPDYPHVNIKVTSGGGGLCEGGLEIVNPDGLAVLNLKPALQADQRIDGFGEYDVYAVPQL